MEGYMEVFQSNLTSSFNLHRRLTEDVAKNLGEALIECTSMNYSYLAEAYFDIPRSETENLKDKRDRKEKILTMVYMWLEQKGQDATFITVCSILDKAGLAGIKEYFLNTYATQVQKSEFCKKRKDWEEFCKQFVSCSDVWRDSWDKITAELGFYEPTEEQLLAPTHRWNYLNVLFEKGGLEVASVKKFEEILKDLKLRRVIHRISKNGKTTGLNKKLLDILEHEWDEMHMKITHEQHTRILQDFSPDRYLDKESTFHKILDGGDFAFHSFMKALLKEMKDDFHDSFTTGTRRWLCKLKSDGLVSKVSDFLETESCRKVTECLLEKRFVTLRGRHGSGRSQIAASYKEAFAEAHPFSLIHVFDCKSEVATGVSLTRLKDVLERSQICCNADASVKEMAKAIKHSQLYVLFLIDGYHPDIYGTTDIKEILRELTSYDKAFCVAIPFNTDDTLGVFHTHTIHGFTEYEASSYLLDGEFDSSRDEVKGAAKEVARTCKCLPLNLAMAKEYCNQFCGSSFSQYLQMLKDDEAFQLIRAFRSQWVNDFNDAQPALSKGEVTNVQGKLLDVFTSEWDGLLGKLNHEQRGRIFQRFNLEKIPCFDEEDAFTKVLREGIGGLQRFMEVVSEECKESLLSNFTEATRNMLERLRPAATRKDPLFIETVTYQQAKGCIFVKRFVGLYGPRGSGKSQVALAFAEDFVRKHPFSIVWPFDCRSSRSIERSWEGLNETLYDFNVYKSMHVSEKKMIDSLKTSCFNVLFVVENVDKLQPDHCLKKLLCGLKTCDNAHVVATVTGTDFRSELFHPYSIYGVSDSEAERLLMDDGMNNDEEKSAAKRVRKRCRNRPLDLAKAKACCQRLCGKSYVRYVEMWERERTTVEECEQRWALERFGSSSDAGAPGSCGPSLGAGTQGPSSKEDRIKILEEKMEETQKDVKQVKENEDALRERIAKLELQEAELLRKINHYESELEKMREKATECDELKSEVEKLRKILEEKEDEIKELKTRLDAKSGVELNKQKGVKEEYMETLQ